MALFEQRRPASDQPPIPERPILFGERDHVAVGGRPGGPPGIDQEHEGEQPGHLRVARELAVDHGREPDRLVGQVDALELATACCSRSPR